MKYDANAKAGGEVNIIDGVSSEVEEQPCCELEIGGLKILSLVDTGAAVSLIKREIVDKLPRGAIACSRPADSSVRDASGNSIGIGNIVNIYFKLCGRKLLAPFHVLDGASTLVYNVL